MRWFDSSELTSTAATQWPPSFILLFLSISFNFSAAAPAAVAVVLVHGRVGGRLFIMSRAIASSRRRRACEISRLY